MELFSVVGKLLLDSSGFDKGVSEADKSGRGLASKLEASFSKIKKFAAGALSVAAIKKGIDSVMQLAAETSAAGDKIDKQSQALGLSRKAYQEWDYILGQSGASIDSMGISMKTLNGLILNAAAGSEESKDAFAQLGLSIHEIETLSMEDQFESVVRAFQKLPPGAQKSALAVQLFGRNGQQLLPLLNSSATTIDELRERAEQLGIIMSDDAVDASVAYNDAMDDLTRTFNGMKYAIGSQLLPVLTRGVTAITNYAGKIKKAYDAEGFKGVWNTLVEDVKSIKWPTWEQVGNAIKTGWNGIVNGVKGLAKLVFGENVDGSIKWPTWEDVQGVANTAWESIKKGASSLGGLVFGKKEDGSVAWPEWSTVWEGLDAFWGAVQDGALSIADTMGGLVFGRSSDGSVQWPDIEQVLSDFNTWWGETAKPAIEDAATWVLKAFGVPEEGAEELGSIISGWWDPLKDGFSDLLDWVLKIPTFDPYTAGQELHTIINDFWTGVKGNLESLLNWVLGIPDMEDADGTSMKEKVKTWWDTQVVPKIKGALNFVLGLFDLPSVDDMVQAIRNWWASVVASVGNLALSIGAIFNPSATANQPKGGRGAYSGEYGYYSGSGANPRTGTTALMNAKGSWSIPYDDYLARLHRGEMVLTASQARRYRDGEGMGFDPSALVSSIVSAIQSGMQGVTVNSYLSGRSISDDVNSRTIRQLKARRFAT